MNSAFLESLMQLPLVSFLVEHNVLLLAPEFTLAFVLLAIVGHVAFAKSEAEQEQSWWLATVGVGIVFVMLLTNFSLYMPNVNAEEVEWLNRPVLFDMFRADLFSLVIRSFLALGTLMVLLFSRAYVRERSKMPGEFYVVLLAALLGGMLLSGAMDLIMLFVALETLGISSYVLVGYLRDDEKSAEAALKYLVYGAMASAILLFGFSLLYGLTGSTNFNHIAMVLSNAGVNNLLLPVLSILILGGFAFKLSAAPFHMWTPDVYEGAPTPITAFLSVVSKIAAFAVVMRFLYTLMGTFEAWFGMILAVSIVSMTIGNVVALTQRNMKRLLAYSTIAHAGYLLLGLAVMTTEGLASLMYYLVAYLFMNLGAFAAVVYFGNLTGGREEVADYAGLVRKRPALTLIFSIMLLSLAGIPITAGFFGKFFLFQAVAQAGSQYLWVVIVALINSTISLYYYLNIIRLMVIVEPSDAVEKMPEEEPQGAFQFSPISMVLTFCLFGTLVLGLFSEVFMNLTRVSVQQLQTSPFMVERVLPKEASVIAHQQR